MCQDSHGNTPFIVAVKNGHGELVTLLIDKGAGKDDLHKVRWRTLTGHVFVGIPFFRRFENLDLSIPRKSCLPNLTKITTSTISSAVKEGFWTATYFIIQGLRIAASRGHKDVVKRILSVLDSDDVLTFLMQIGINLTDSGAPLEEEKNCVVCMENGKDAVIVPCGHTACCFSCCESLPAPRLCPMCRVEVRLVQRMYPYFN